MRAEIGPSPWSGMSWKRGNWRILGCSTEISRPEKPATERGRRASSSLYKLVGLVQYRYPSIVTIRAASDAARISSNEEHAKPFSMLLPALKPKHFCLDCPRRWCQGLPLRLSGCRVGKEHTPSPKRRKIDLTPEFVSSNITRESVITNVFMRSACSASPVSIIHGIPGAKYERRSSAFTITSSFLSSASTCNSPYPDETPTRKSPASRRTTQCQVNSNSIPSPDNCNRTNPEWEANRITFRKEKERELKNLEIIGKCITRYVCLFPLVPSLSDWNIVFIYVFGFSLFKWWRDFHSMVNTSFTRSFNLNIY